MPDARQRSREAGKGYGNNSQGNGTQETNGQNQMEKPVLEYTEKVEPFRFQRGLQSLL